MWIKSLLKNGGVAAFFATLVYFNIVSLQNHYFGWFFLVLFFLWTSKLVHIFLVKYFGLSSSLRIRILSIFFVLAVLGFITGLLSWLFKFTPLALSFSFFFVGLALSFFNQDADDIPEIYDSCKQVFEEVPSSKVGLFLYLVLVAAGFYFLNGSKTELSILTPWQTISVSYVYIFFAATLVLGFLIFSKLKSSILLFLLILHSLLLHAYLPLTHSLFYGADGWRHLAIENSMLFEGVQKTLSFSVDPVSFWQRFNFGGLAYAQFNSLAVLFKLITQMDLILFLRYFIPVIWAVVLPILLFEIARAFNWEKKRALLFVYLSALPFALQVSGSFSLPSNLSFLFWLMILLLQFKNRQKYTLIGQVTIVIFGALSIFGHSLYFILFCLSLFLIKLLNFPSNRTIFKTPKILFVTVFSILLIPVLELFSHFSSFSWQINLWTQTKALLSSFSAWYVATGLRLTDITAGNIIFNQPPLNSLIINLFTVNRLWICGFMLMFWLAFVLGWHKLLFKQKDNLNYVWLSLTIGLLGGYIISRYFLVGENILSRRLDAVLAVLIIFPVAYWLYEITTVQKTFFYQRAVLFLVILFCSMAITASYTLGPDTQAVSRNQYLSADYIWQKESVNKNNPCVLADTYTLLALEGISGKRIIGGGFPLNLYFSQPEREQLLKLAKDQPQLALSQSKKLLSTDNCYLVGMYSLPGPIAQFGNIKIYNN